VRCWSQPVSVSRLVLIGTFMVLQLFVNEILCYRFYWDILIVSLLMFTVIILPVSIAFYSDAQLQPEWLAINSLVDFLFITDIVVNFRTGLIVPDKNNEVCRYTVI